jgi:hypothetical protein
MRETLLVWVFRFLVGIDEKKGEKMEKWKVPVHVDFCLLASRDTSEQVIEDVFESAQDSLMDESGGDKYSIMEERNTLSDLKDFVLTCVSAYYEGLK